MTEFLSKYLGFAAFLPVALFLHHVTKWFDPKYDEDRHLRLWSIFGAMIPCVWLIICMKYGGESRFKSWADLISALTILFGTILVSFYGSTELLEGRQPSFTKLHKYLARHRQKVFYFGVGLVGGGGVITVIMPAMALMK